MWPKWWSAWARKLGTPVSQETRPRDKLNRAQDRRTGNVTREAWLEKPALAEQLNERAWRTFVEPRASFSDLANNAAVSL